MAFERATIGLWLLCAGASVIDVGCGGGILTERLAREGASVLGIDMVEESLEVARQHLKLSPAIEANVR